MTTGITSILKNILKFITFIGAVVAAVFLLRAFVIEPFVVPTGSMESTIEVGDCILAQKITLETGSDLKSGDIVVFKNPRPRNGVDILVKRVIATSGQTVDLKDGKVYVDGRRLDESYAMGESKPLDAHMVLLAKDLVQKGSSRWLVNIAKPIGANSKLHHRTLARLPTRSLSSTVSASIAAPALNISSRYIWQSGERNPNRSPTVRSAGESCR